VLTADDALGFSAIQLFAERAMASLNTFELSDADIPTVVDICRRLDGLPLAIELAAARVDLFGIRGLAARLDDRLRLLTRGRRTAVSRHQTLRATLDWSYEILPRIEQIGLRRLAVFAGAFDARSATAVIADDEVQEADVLELLANLAAKSLLITHAAGDQVFYRLFDTSRAYALEKLDDSHESVEIKRRHAQLCCSWGKHDLGCEPQSIREWTAGVSQRLDDVRAALDWCSSQDGDPSLG
jgi:predicted ATPase